MPSMIDTTTALADSLLVRVQTGLSDRLSGDSERGAAMTEYGLLLVVALLAAFAILALFGEAVLGLFEDAYDQFSNAWGGGSSTPTP